MTKTREKVQFIDLVARIDIVKPYMIKGDFQGFCLNKNSMFFKDSEVTVSTFSKLFEEIPSEQYMLKSGSKELGTFYFNKLTNSNPKASYIVGPFVPNSQEKELKLEVVTEHCVVKASTAMREDTLTAHVHLRTPSRFSIAIVDSDGFTCASSEILVSTVQVLKKRLGKRLPTNLTSLLTTISKYQKIEYSSIEKLAIKIKTQLVKLESWIGSLDSNKDTLEFKEHLAITLSKLDAVYELEELSNLDKIKWLDSLYKRINNLIFNTLKISATVA